MKKILFLVLFISLILGCSNKDEASFVSISQNDLVVNAEGGEYVIKVKANCLWDINCHGEWIHAVKGEDDLRLSIPLNNTYAERISEITVFGEGIVNTITVTQKQNWGFITEKTDIAVDGHGGEVKISLNTNIENIQIKTPDWIKILDSKDTRSLSPKYFIFLIEPNNTKIERKGEIYFSGEGEDVVYNIMQDVINPSRIYTESPWPEFIAKLGIIKIPLFISPQGASLKNVSFKSSNEAVCNASLEKETLVLDVRKSGKATISCFISNNVVWSFLITSYNSESIRIWAEKDDVRGFLAGDNIVIKSNIPLSLFNFYTDTPKLISINGDKITALNAGIAKIIAVEKANQYRFELFPEIVDVRMYNDVYQHFSPYKGIFRLLSNNRIYVFSISLIDHNLNKVLTVYGDQLQSNNSKNVYWEYSYFPLNGLFSEDIQKHSFKCRYAFFKEDGTYEERTVSIPFNER